MSARRARLVRRAVSEGRVRANARAVAKLVRGGRADLARRARRMQASAERTYRGRPTLQDSETGENRG